MAHPTAARWVARFWAGEAGLAGRVADAALAPAEALYVLATGARNLAYDRGLLAVERAPIPVISVGNLGVGGAGKTPFSAWLAERLHSWGRRPAVVLSGYAEDEVLLHQRLHPLVPSLADPDRSAAVRAAARAGCDVAVLDDGFQHRRLARNLDLVLVAAEGWRRRVRLLPRGPWRESARALERASAVVVTRKTAGRGRARQAASEISELIGDRPIVLAHLAPVDLEIVKGADRDPRPLDWLRGRRVLAVAAIADPRPFADQLRATGADAELIPFPDHHPFSAAEVESVVNRAGGRPLVVTQKDAVKLASLLPDGAEAYAVRQRVVIEGGGEALDAVLRRALGGET